MSRREKLSEMYTRMARTESTEQVSHERSLGSGAGIRAARKLAADYTKKAAAARKKESGR